MGSHRYGLVAAGCCLACVIASCAHNGDAGGYAAPPPPPLPPPPLPPPPSAPAPAMLDADMETVIDALMSLDSKPIDTLSAAQARRQPTVADAVIEVLQERGEAAPEPRPAVGRVDSRLLHVADGPAIPARVYTPAGDAEGPLPVIVYYHGGGWVIGSVDAYDASCRALSDRTGAVVVSVDYRQAPEYRFPAAHEDAYAALQHVMANAARFRGDPARVAVAGESAGGNLAAAVCLMAKERGGRMPVHQLLVYPITNYAFDTPSYRENAEAVPLNAGAMRWFFQRYLNTPVDGQELIVSPLRASVVELRGLPPATVILAQVDPLRSEGQAYAEKLRAAGVDVSANTYKGVTHEFFGTAAVVGQAGDAQRFAADRLRRSFQGSLVGRAGP